MIHIKTLIFLAAIVLFTTSCSTTFYQVYKTTPVGSVTASTNSLVYEDDNCKVSYNFWDDGGDVGFLFHNKTDKAIYVNLEESFYIINGVAKNYYRGRIFSESINSGASTSKTLSASTYVTGYNYLNLLQTNKGQASSTAGLITSKGYSTDYVEEKIIQIPAKTSKIITEYDINTNLFRDCDLYRYPTKSQVISKSFTKSNSPIVFSNRIAYTVGKSEEIIRFENEFYVNEIANYPENEMLESSSKGFCDQKNSVRSKIFKDVAPDKFYIRYSKQNNAMKH